MPVQGEASVTVSADGRGAQLRTDFAIAALARIRAEWYSRIDALEVASADGRGGSRDLQDALATIRAALAQPFGLDGRNKNQAALAELDLMVTVSEQHTEYWEARAVRAEQALRETREVLREIAAHPLTTPSTDGPEDEPCSWHCVSEIVDMARAALVSLPGGEQGESGEEA
jgi:hypothetical protein